MPVTTLPSARIDQLPDGIAREGDFFVFRDMVTGVTRRILVNQFLPSPTSQNFQWLTDTEYDTDEIVTYGGSIWQSTIDNNENIVPGTNPGSTDPAPWVEIPQAPDGLSFWVAGTYLSDKPLKFSDHTGSTGLYQLVNPTRPYVSTDIEAETVAGDWVNLFEIHNRGNWTTNDALPTIGSGISGALDEFDQWVIPDAGWNYGEYVTGSKWTILMYMGGDPTDFESFKLY